MILLYNDVSLRTVVTMGSELNILHEFHSMAP
jgi:hypothetical protein